MECKVSLRGEKEEAVTVENPATVGRLRRAVQEALLQRPIQRGQREDILLPSAQQILVFQNTPVELLLDDNIALSSDMKYSCFEKFSTAPVDLYRTVKFSQVYPVVKASIPSQFTAVVPLYCASLEEGESKSPPYRRTECDLRKSGRVVFVGASLQCIDDFNGDAAHDPWSEVSKEENKAGRQVDLETLQGTYQESKNAEPVGILGSSKLYTVNGVEMFDNQKLKDDKGKTLKTRNYYWRFKLERGTDLKEVGMYTVCDKVDGHFSLVPEKDCSHAVLKSPEARPLRGWAPRQFSMLPVWEPDPNVSQPDPPEAFLTSLFRMGSLVVAFPVAAQKFQFHDLVMKASARPWDLTVNEDDYDDDQKKLGAASNVLFDYSNELSDTYDILNALNVLRESDFKMKAVPLSECALLHEMMDNLSSTEDIIEEREVEILVGGMAVIDKHLKSLGVSPPSLCWRFPMKARQ